MIRPSRHDFNIARSSFRAQGDSGENRPRFAGSRFEISEQVANGIAMLAGAVACMWFFHTFLEAVPALSRVVTGGR